MAAGRGKGRWRGRGRRAGRVGRGGGERKALLTSPPPPPPSHLIVSSISSIYLISSLYLDQKHIYHPCHPLVGCWLPAIQICACLLPTDLLCLNLHYPLLFFYGFWVGLLHTHFCMPPSLTLLSLWALGEGLVPAWCLPACACPPHLACLVYPPQCPPCSHQAACFLLPAMRPGFCFPATTLPSCLFLAVRLPSFPAGSTYLPLT